MLRYFKPVSASKETQSCPAFSQVKISNTTSSTTTSSTTTTTTKVTKVTKVTSSSTNSIDPRRKISKANTPSKIMQANKALLVTPNLSTSVPPQAFERNPFAILNDISGVSVSQQNASSNRVQAGSLPTHQQQQPRVSFNQSEQHQQQQQQEQQTSSSHNSRKRIRSNSSYTNEEEDIQTQWKEEKKNDDNDEDGLFSAPTASSSFSQFGFFIQAKTEVEQKSQEKLLFEPWGEKGMEQRAGEWLKGNNLQAKLGFDLSALTLSEATNLLGVKKGHAFVFRVKAMKRLQKYASFSSSSLSSSLSSLSSSCALHHLDSRESLSSNSFIAAVSTISTDAAAAAALSCSVDTAASSQSVLYCDALSDDFLSSFFPSSLISSNVDATSLPTSSGQMDGTPKRSQFWLNSSHTSLNFTCFDRDIIRRRSARFYNHLFQPNFHLLPFVYAHMDSIQNTRQNPYISCMRFDAQGCLLAAGSTTGIVAVHDFDFTLASHVIHDNAQRLFAVPSPVCLIETNGFCVECIKWHPLNDSMLFVSSSQHNSMYLYDLMRGDSVIDTPTHTFSHSSSLSSLSAKSSSNGILDFDFRSGSKSVVVGGCKSGEIAIWDLRDQFVGKRPAKLAGRGGQGLSSSVQSVQVFDDLVFSIKRNGDVVLWDIRQTACELRKISLLSLYSDACHQLQQQQSKPQLVSSTLTQRRLEGFRRGLQGLQLGVSSAQLCPNSSSMICFQLLNGGVGYMNAATQSISPLVCSLPSDEVSSLEYRPRKFATKFDYDTGTTAAYYGTLNSAVDCAELQQARCVHSFESIFRGEKEGLIAEEILVAPTVLSSLDICASSMSVACHPTSNFIVCGTDDNRLLAAASDHVLF